MNAYHIKTDAGSTTVTAESMDAAARAWAESEGIAGVTGTDSLAAKIESIDGAWLWIESDDAADGARVYAGRANMA